MNLSALHSLKLRNHVGFSVSDLRGYFISREMPAGDAPNRERPESHAVFRDSYFDSVSTVGVLRIPYSAPGALG